MINQYLADIKELCTKLDQNAILATKNNKELFV